MDWIPILLIAAAVSFDSLAIGVTYGMAKISIPTIPRLLLSIISAVFLLIAMVVGSWLTQWFSPTVTDVIGGAILVVLGIYSIWRGLQPSLLEPTSTSRKKPEIKPHLVYDLKIPMLGLIIHVIKQPLAADYDKSKIISMHEALLLGLALALDAFAAGIGVAILGFPAIATALAVMVANFLFVSQGLRTGSLLKQTINRLSIQWLPGAIIILIGLVKIIT